RPAWRPASPPPPGRCAPGPPTSPPGPCRSGPRPGWGSPRDLARAALHLLDRLGESLHHRHEDPLGLAHQGARARQAGAEEAVGDEDVDAAEVLVELGSPLL